MMKSKTGQLCMYVCTYKLINTWSMKQLSETYFIWVFHYIFETNLSVFLTACLKRKRKKKLLPLNKQQQFSKVVYTCNYYISKYYYIIQTVQDAFQKSKVKMKETKLLPHWNALKQSTRHRQSLSLTFKKKNITLWALFKTLYLTL